MWEVLSNFDEPIGQVTWVCNRCGQTCTLFEVHRCYTEYRPQPQPNMERVIALLEDILEELKALRSLAWK